MTKYIGLKSVCCLLFAAGAAFPAGAQDGDALNTPASVERIKAGGLWLTHTNNAAGAILDNASYYANAAFDYHMSNGTFKQAQSGKRNNGFGFSTDGGGFLGDDKKFYVWGEFNYSRDKIREAQYNASLIDPLRRMPFYIADTSKSKWINQGFDMRVKAATHLIRNKLLLGFEGRYEVGNGAKQKDPRPEVELSRVEVIPSLLFRFGKRHSIGADFDYYSRRERGEASVTNLRNNPSIWMMVAPGFFKQGSMDPNGSPSGLGDYNANSMGGGLQYGYTAERIRIVLSGNYARTVEDAKTADHPNPSPTTTTAQSTERPYFLGTTRKDAFDVNLNAKFDNASGSHSWYVNLSYRDDDMDGIEYIQSFDNAPDVQEYVVDFKTVRSNYTQQSAKGEVSLMRNGSGNDYRWTVGADAEYVKDGYIYYIPRSTQDVESLRLNAYAKKNFRTGDLSRLLVGLKVGGSKNLSAEMDYNGYHAEEQCFTDFTLKDFYYLSSSYVHAGASVTYSHLGILKNTAVYTGAAFDIYKMCTHKDLFDQRIFMQFNLGMTF